MLDSDRAEGDRTLTTITREPRSPFRLIDGLNAEWERLSATSCDHVEQWRHHHPALSDCRELPDVLAVVAQDPDWVLAALLQATADGDELAGRTVLQTMLGKIVRMASMDRTATADDYVAAMWCRIRTYPLRQRPRSIAANLALDVLKAVRRESSWGRQARDVALVSSADVMDFLHTRSVARNALDHGEEISRLTADEVITMATSLGLLDAKSREVLTTVYADGLSGRAAAERHGTTAAMIRYRCSKAVRRLSRHSATLVEAA